jgi:hypothetical protein
VADRLIQMHKTMEEDIATTSARSPGNHEAMASGRIHAIAPDGTILVAIPSDNRRTYRAGTLVPVHPEDVGRDVVLAFTTERGNSPVILGMVAERSQSEPKSRLDMERSDVVDYRIDGQTIHLTADQEILLECGQGSIRLRKDGKIIIKGLQIVSRSKGANKIKGAAVSIN